MKYWVYLRGSSTGEWITAPNMTAAKEIFALKHGVTLSGYIAASRRGPLAAQ